MEPTKAAIRITHNPDAKNTQLAVTISEIAKHFGAYVVVQKADKRLDKGFKVTFDFNDKMPSKTIAKLTLACAHICQLIETSEKLQRLFEGQANSVMQMPDKAVLEKNELYFNPVKNHYFQIYYPQTILKKKDFQPDDLPNWTLDGKEPSGLKKLLEKLKDKILKAGGDWGQEMAIASFCLILDVAIKKDPKFYHNKFSIAKINSDFEQIYRYGKSSGTSAKKGTDLGNIDQRFNDFFKDK